jgi:chromosome segregation ATPase
LQALQNGYCPVHQDVAVSEISKILMLIYKQLGRLLQVDDPVNPQYSTPLIENLMKQIQVAVTNFKNRNVLCDQTCRETVRLITAVLTNILLPGGKARNHGPKHPATVLVKLLNALYTLVFDCKQGSLEASAESTINASRAISVAMNMNQRDLVMIKNKIKQLEGEQQLNRQKDKLNEAELMREREANSRTVQQHDKIILELQNKLDRANTQLAQRQAGSGEIIRALQEKLIMAENSVKRTVKDLRIANAQQEAMQTELLELRAKMTGMKKVHEKDRQALKDKFAIAAKGTELQKQLYNEIKELREKLASRDDQLLEFKKVYDQSVDTINRLGSNLTDETAAAMFEDTARELQRAQDELSRSRNENAKLRHQVAQLNHSVARQVAEAVRAHKQESMSSKEAELKEHERHALTKKAHNELQRLYNLHVTKHEGEKKRLESQLNVHRRKAESARRQLQMQIRMYEDKRVELEQKYQAKISQNDYQMRELEETLKNRHNASLRVLRDRQMTLEQELNSSRQQIQIKTEQLNRRQQEIAADKKQIEQQRLRLSAELDKFAKQRNELSRRLKKAETSLAYYRTEETRLQDRLGALARTMAADRQENADLIAGLRGKVRDLEKKNAGLQTKLVQHRASCSEVFRNAEKLEQKVKQLEDRIRIERIQKEKIKSEHSVYVSKLQADVAKAQNDTNEIRQKLTEAAAVHAHSKRMLARMKMLKSDTEQKASEVRDRANAMQRLMNENVANKRELARRQAAMGKMQAMIRKLEQEKLHLTEQTQELQEMAAQYNESMRNTRTILDEKIARDSADREREKLRNQTEINRLTAQRDREIAKLERERQRRQRLIKRNNALGSALLYQKVNEADTLQRVLGDEN